MKYVVVHWVVGTLESADATFAKADRIASAHYGIGDTDIHQYVQESDTAYHASNITVNTESIGIEHEGGWLLADKVNRFIPTEATVQTSIELVTDICRRYGIPADKDHIKRHSDIKATECPGSLPVERIIEEVGKRLNPSDSLKWLKGMYQEQGIDLTRPEGEVRARVQEIFDGWKKYGELEKRLQKTEKDLAGAKAEAADFEQRLITSEGTTNRLNKELADLRDSVTSRDTEISSLKSQVDSLKDQIDPSKIVMVPKEEYLKLLDAKKKMLEAAKFVELIKALFKKLFRK